MDGKDDRIVGIIILCVAAVTLLLDVALFLIIAGLSKSAAKDAQYGVSAQQADYLRQFMALFALLDVGLAAGNAAIGIGVLNSRRWAFIGGLVMAVIDAASATFGLFGMCLNLGYILAATMGVYSLMRLAGKLGAPPA